ncbi:piggyBac transposable element-derived protein 3-like [Ischnura elegans]|uniref:piggyBac transposable element-derived protein 3-like n=1 Tax=Ischnura elegans TaxID=197161 RepID=UPI001ED87911|nr:piggyBac transposable element-derived protein 3-like [Ischnura elegans]
MTLQEVLSALEDDQDDVLGIYIEPPESNVLSDEDSAEEDGGGFIDNLSGRQLRAGAEILVSTQRGECESDGLETSDKRVNSKRKKVKRVLPTWKDEDLCVKKSLFPDANYCDIGEKSPSEIFELFFDDELINFLILQSKDYAALQNFRNLNITAAEMKVFLGILILSGYNNVPSKRDYWDSSGDLRNEFVANAMRRDRFLQISRFLHCANNCQPNAEYKMWKLRPIMNMLKTRFLAMFRPEEHLDFDECMIEYFGRHPCKQFLRGKPIRFGYKVWSLNTTAGYLVNFDVYQGRNPASNSEYEKMVGKCAAPLLQMLDEIPQEKKNLAYKLYFDNLFTGFELLKELRSRGYGATGTIRENRIPKDCPIMPSKEIRNKQRGFYDKCLSEEDGILLVKWVDNSTVRVATTCHSIQPVAPVRRFSRAEMRNVRIPRPSVISEYNRYMGGTDRMDENVSYYRIGIRGKKWWWCIFTWLTDTHYFARR